MQNLKNFDLIKSEADKIFDRKIASGKYKDYPDYAIAKLYEDCFYEAKFILKTREIKI